MIPHFGIKRQHQLLKDELLESTSWVLESGQFLDGYFTKKFEKWLTERTSYKYAITCHSGTQALEIIALYEFTLHGESE